MDDLDKTREQFIKELEELRQQNARLKESQSSFKLSEEELRKREETYRELVQNANSIILRMDLKGNVTFFNKFAQSFFGYSEGEIIGRNVVGTIVPEVDSSGRDLKAMIEDIGSQPELYKNNENENLCSNGKRVWVSWTNKGIHDKNGNISEILCIGNDITERKRVEIELKKAYDELEKRVEERTADLKTVNEQLRREITERKLAEEGMKDTKNRLNNIIESSLDSIIVSDSMGYVTRVNNSFLKLIGYNEEELIGKHISELTPYEEGTYDSTTGEMVEIDEKFIVDATEIAGNKLFEKGKISNWESYFLRKDKKIVPVEVNIAYLYNEKGDIIGSVGISRDITGRKKAEKEIKETQDFLEKIFKTSADAIVVTDNEGTIIMVNETTKKMLGYSGDELIGKSVAEFGLKDKKYREEGEKMLVKLMEEGAVNGVERVWTRKDGNLVNIEVNSSLLIDEEGNITGAVGSIRDITERKRAEKEIKETRDFLETVIEGSRDGIVITDEKGHIFSINSAMEQMCGFDKEEVIGKHASDLLVDDKQTKGRIIEKMVELFEKGFISYESKYKTKDGNYVDVENYSSLIKDNNGNVIAGVSIERDITERKKAEREIKEARDFLENIITTSVDGIIIVNPQGAITRVNEAAKKITGYTEEELKGMHISQLGSFDDEFRIWLRRDMVGRLFKNGKYKEFEAMWKRKDGKLISIEINASLLKNKEGEIIGGVNFVRDISERKKIQEIEMKNAFISNISHEFRTPLTLSIGPLEGLLRGECGDIKKEAKDQIGLALRNNRRQLKLVNQLLEFNRLGSKSEDVSYYRKDINQFLSTIVDSFAFLATKKEIKLNFLPGKCIEPAYIDPGKMERVLLNIIGNAFKFTPRGGSIIIDAKNGEEEVQGDFIKIYVKDTGIGIKEEDLPLIFERFQQTDNSSSRRHEGTGIGLSLAKELIELQGGKIEVESEYGSGSTFTIYIPTGKDHISDQNQIKEESDEITLTQKEIELSDLGYDEVKIREEKPTGERPLILFIDDNLDVRRYVTGILSKKYDVITAEDGLKGLERLKEYIPDLIISDIMMPRMDGYQFCKSVKSNPELRHIPLIFLTAKADTELKIEGLEEGADDYIVKPFNSQELLARVKSILRIRELIRENLAKEKKISELTKVLGERHQYHNIIGKALPMQEIYRLLEKIKDTELPVLISGETGTGKELVAHAIQNNSKRKDNPFIILNCTAISKNLLESELFGHIKGAFTGAIADKKGIFEVADGGTLFLDEIAEMSLSAQVKLLRVLEEGTFRPVGSSEEKKVSVRIIAATNKDLKKLIDKGRFREDLYYRINVININLPTLRERKEDISLLVEHFIKEPNGKKGDKKKLSEKALSQLMEYSYPGNVRELKNVVERTFMLCEGNLINYKDLPLEVRRDAKGSQLPLNDSRQELNLERMERETILQALKQVKGNKIKAAKLLNISRSTLYVKIEKYHIEC
jgi:PAS domain S-box-containing protein